MADTSTVAGVTTVMLGTFPLRVRGSVKIQGLTTKQESVMGLDGYHGVKTTPIPPSLELEVTVDRPFSLKSLDGMQGQTVVANCPAGRQLILYNAAYVGDGAEYDPAEGKLTVKFEGARLIEVLPA